MTLEFVDRLADTNRLQSAILDGRSMIICGPSGIGKTALVLKVLADLPRAVAARCLYLPGIRDLRDLLTQLLGRLYETKNPNLRRGLHAAGVTATTFAPWLRAKSSSHLRGMLYRAVEGSDYRIVLDHLPHLTLGVARVIKELFWMRNTPVYLLLRGDAQQVLGEASRFFYWGHRERLQLAPLPRAAAEKMLGSCIEHFALSRLNLCDFREEVLELSGCVPGAIVKMCALASDPRYQYGTCIKTKLIHIDCLTSRQRLTTPEAGRIPVNHEARTD
jgi:hypothetical protein